jgi:hypothetical protein
MAIKKPGEPGFLALQQVLATNLMKLSVLTDHSDNHVNQDVSVQ